MYAVHLYWDRSRRCIGDDEGFTQRITPYQMALNDTGTGITSLIVVPCDEQPQCYRKASLSACSVHETASVVCRHPRGSDDTAGEGFAVAVSCGELCVYQVDRTVITEKPPIASRYLTALKCGKRWNTLKKLSPPRRLNVGTMVSLLFAILTR